MDVPLSDPPLPSPPFIHCPGVANLRDIGGYPLPSSASSTFSTSSTNNPLSVRRNLLLRSADPTRITRSGLATLATQHRVRTVYDLRSTPEIQRVGREWSGVEPLPSPFRDRTAAAAAPPPHQDDDEEGGEKKTHERVRGPDDGGGGGGGGGGIESVWTPVFEDSDYGPDEIAVRYRAYASGAEGFRQAYRDILLHAGRGYGVVLRDLAARRREEEEDGGHGAVLVHCTAGKDRTGVLVALVYMLLGVEEDVICKEYALTDQGLKLLKPVFRERLLKNEALAGNEEGVDSMISAKEENMRLTIGLINEVWGGAEGYMKEVVGLSDDEIARLRHNFESDEKPVL